MEMDLLNFAKQVVIQGRPKKFRMDLPGQENENQSSNSESLRVESQEKRSGTEELEPRKSCVKVDHPLLMPEILELVFSHMHQYNDDTTIRDICQVNQLWSEIMRKKMDKFETSEMFRFPRQGEPSASCKKFVVTLPLENLAEVNKLMQARGTQIRELNISFKTALEEDDLVLSEEGDDDSTVESLLENIQRWCPNLKTVIIWRNPLDVLPSPEYSSAVMSRSYMLPVREVICMFWSDSGACDILSHFVQNSPRIASLTFMHSQVNVMTFVLQSLSPLILSNLVTFRAKGMGLTDQFIQFFLQKSWRLKFLDIEFEYCVQQQRMRQLLSHVSGTVERLKVKLNDLEFDFGPLVPAEAWMFPVTLKRLKELELIVHSQNATECSSCFVNALHLPSLQWLKLSRTARFSYPATSENENLTQNINLFGILWNSSQSPNNNNNSEPPAVAPIRRLSITQTLTDASLFQQIPNPLANLKELDIQSTSVDVFLAIFASQLNLERLSIVTDSFEIGSNTWDSKWRDFPHLVGRVLDWDEILTARIKTFDKERNREDPPYLMLPSTPSLRNLSNLKYLQISPIDSDSYLTDFFIYNALGYLTQLQHVSIRENFFSVKALEFLRSRLLPFCHIEIRYY